MLCLREVVKCVGRVFLLNAWHELGRAITEESGRVLFSQKAIVKEYVVEGYLCG